MSAARRAALVALLVVGLPGCVVPVLAKGLVTTGAEGPVITAPNAASRPLVLDAAASPLAYADGLFVELEGTLRKGAIEVEAWRVVQGPHGLSAWVGRVVAGVDGDPALDVRDEGGTWGLRGPGRDAAADLLGRTVLVEGLVSGPLIIQVLHVRSLDGRP